MAKKLYIPTPKMGISPKLNVALITSLLVAGGFIYFMARNQKFYTATNQAVTEPEKTDELTKAIESPKNIVDIFTSTIPVFQIN